ncbi:hypothetical protein [Catalinimonas niigatensis]|uniref:hypothetical protein n=1 Tax=Catalinimonas niigatensis TaxID=1397264 RepID=UPI0026652600|nr:hypothetical protein [Catalinimonas niigatensis]WPP52952.1 hypothetical protein PZB72_11255 [Catalinimonas niigatensis]
MRAPVCIFLLAAATFFVQSTASAQVGVSYHQSGLPFVGVQYNFAGQPIMAEFRLSTDRDFDDISPEIVATYSFINKPQHQVYGGLGLRVNVLEGIVFPIGIKVYPIQSFSGLGLHVELAPSIATNEFESENILRGSWGFHYIFGRNED